MYRETMTELEILVDLRGIYISDFSEKSAVEEGIIYMLELLTEYDVNTTELNAIEELERLAEMRVNFAQQHRQVPDWTAVLASRDTFDKLINSKINFVKNGSFSRLISKGGLEPMAALQRLVVVKRKINSHHIDGLMEELLESKIREVVWRPRVKASSRQSSSGKTLLMHSSALPYPPRTLVPKPRQSPSRQVQSFPLLRKASLTEYHRLLKSKRTPSATYPTSAKGQKPQRSLC